MEGITMAHPEQHVKPVAEATSTPGSAPASPTSLRLELSAELQTAIARALAPEAPPSTSRWQHLKDLSGVIALVISAGWILFVHYTITAPKAAVDQRSTELKIAASQIQLQRLEGTPFEIGFETSPVPAQSQDGTSRFLQVSLDIKNLGERRVKVQATTFEVFRVASTAV